MTGLTWEFRLRHAAAAALLLGLASQSASAQDALNGRSLYQNGPVGGGGTCVACHGASPANNVSNIQRAANQPSVIAAAIARNAGGGMGQFAGRFSSAELADIAAYIANPTVTASPAASLAPASLAFSGTSIGQTSAPLSTTLSSTGSAALNIGNITLGGAAAGDYSLTGGSCANGAAIAAGANCTVQVSFRPTAAGARAATLTITHNATGGSSAVALSGTGNATPQATIALSAPSVNFGAQLTGAASGASTITVTNSGQAPLAFTSIAVGGANANIFTLGGNCAVATPLPVNASCSVTVQATPTAAGAFAGSLTLASNASNGAATVALSGTASAAAPALTASPSALAFGLRTISSPATSQTVVLANTGNVAVAFTRIALTGSSSFTIAAGDCGATLAVGASCSVPVRFAPTADGAVTSTLGVTSNAAAVQVAITGSGTTQSVGVPVLSETGPIAFADTQVGASAAEHTTTVGNTGSAAVRISTLSLGGAQAGDFVTGGTCAANGTVSAGASCTITTAFRPTAAGARSASLLLVTDAGAQFTLPLSGNGVAVAVSAPSLGVSPQSFDFGAVTIGAAAPTRRFSLTNSGSTALTLASAAFSGPFAAVADSTGCAAFPFTLQPGATCDLVVRYTPVNAGGNSGNAVIQSNVAGGSWTIALNGQANAAPSNATPQNRGGGGCSASQSVNDPMLALLAMLSLGVIVWRRRRNRDDQN
ncbi:Cytochrome c553 [Duganella sp. CF517]|uniref:choice-of-anchor D domain-containing protein n=1 Tax=Duganella sp. CF517 TaxID=1881038 RepID=UPI0008B97705|nr:choice-of-anchor D domain-containing protein [Duganella sp. CF517]SEO45169.1 Cytochrome c553 [Duganella sp. CF517]